MKIADTTVLVIGGNRGLGRALVEEALRRGGGLAHPLFLFPLPTMKAALPFASFGKGGLLNTLLREILRNLIPEWDSPPGDLRGLTHKDGRRPYRSMVAAAR